MKTCDLMHFAGIAILAAFLFLWMWWVAKQVGWRVTLSAFGTAFAFLMGILGAVYLLSYPC